MHAVAEIDGAVPSRSQGKAEQLPCLAGHDIMLLYMSSSTMRLDFLWRIGSEY